MTMRSSNDYPASQEIWVIVLIYICSHFMFFNPLNICDFTPLWGKQGRCNSAHLGQSGATRTQELGSPCPVLCKTLPHRGGSRPEQYTIRGALLKKTNSKISYFYKYYKHRWPCYYMAREPPQTLRRNRASAGPWMVSLLGSMVQVLLQPCHSCHSALPSHSSSWGLRYLSRSLLHCDWVLWEIFWYQVEICFLKLLPHLDYHVKRNSVHQAGTWSVKREPALILPRMSMIPTSHLSDPFPLRQWNRRSKSPTSSDSLGFMYIRLNYIKLLCLWVKNSWMSVVSYGSV